jgi:HD superfamily phosphohydrolase
MSKELISEFEEASKETKEKIKDIFGKLEENKIESFANSLSATILTYAYLIIIMRGEHKKRMEDVARKLFKTIAFPHALIERDKSNEGLAEQIGNSLTSFTIIKGLVDETFLGTANLIVLNTICADLLDYVKRDFYFCGIEKSYDPRFIKYAVVVDKGKEPVFAYRIISRRNELKHSVLSSILDLLELRYSLREIVHFHHTKNSLSAMIIEAFNFYYQGVVDKQSLKKELIEMGDDELIKYISERNETARYILDYYLMRWPYEEIPIYQEWNGEDRKISDFTRILRDPEVRYFIEKSIVVATNNSADSKEKLREGDVLIYVAPSPETLYKELETFVVYVEEENGVLETRIETLRDSSKKLDVAFPKLSGTAKNVANRAKEEIKMLANKYNQIWRLSLFVSPKVERSYFQKIENNFLTICEKIISPHNPLVNPDLIEALASLKVEHSEIPDARKISERIYKCLSEHISHQAEKS